MQLALERLGARLIVSPKLISDGVDALKGNESVRLADARLLLGLSWGGIAAQMRLSTACVRAFLLLSAIKVCAYDDRGIADIIYEYLSSAKLLDFEPVSVQQLKSLVDVLSGHSDALLPSVQRTMDDVIQSLADQGPNNWPRSCLDLLAVKSIAEIFLRCFEAIQQDEGGYIEISGQDGLIWIATVLLWLSPDEVGLFSQRHLLFGAAHGKVRIMVCNPLNTTNRSGWEIRTWKAEKSFTTIIAADDTPDWAPPRRTRPKILRKNVRLFFLREGFDEAQLDLVGALAAGLIDAALRFGKLCSLRNDAPTYDARPPEAPLKLLYKQSYVERGGRVMEEYGWKLSSIRAHAMEFLARYTEEYRSPDRGSIDVSNLLASFFHGTQRGVYIKTGEYNRRAPFAGPNRAVLLAQHALASAQTNYGTLVQFYLPPLEPRDHWIYPLLTSGDLSFSDLIERFYIAAGVDIDRVQRYYGGVPIIVSSEGRVLFPRTLLDHSTRQDSLLELVVVPGRIHYDGSYFDAVVDNWSRSVYRKIPHEAPLKSPISGPLFHGQISVGHIGVDDLHNCFDEESQQSPLRLPYEQKSMTLQYYFAIDQRLLLMRTLLSYNQSSSIMHVSYLACLENLAFAFHIGESRAHQCSLCHISDIKAFGVEKFNLIESLAPANWLEAHKEPCCFVAYVPSSQEVRFFASHPHFQPRDFSLYILHGVEVIKALHMMTKDDKQTSPKWRVITGKDE